MIIELYGLPGSGKTHLTNELESTHGFTRVRLDNKLEVVFYFLLFLIMHASLSLQLYFLYWNKVKGSYLWWNLIIFRYAKLQRAVLLNSEKPIILDEGPLQNILSLPELFPAEKIHALLGKHLNKRYVYVVFDISHTIRNARFEIHGYKQKDRFSENERSKWVDVSNKINELFIEIIKTHENFLVIDDDSDPAKDILSFIKTTHP